MILQNGVYFEQLGHFFHLREDTTAIIAVSFIPTAVTGAIAKRARAGALVIIAVASVGADCVLFRPLLTQNAAQCNAVVGSGEVGSSTGSRKTCCDCSQWRNIAVIDRKRDCDDVGCRSGSGTRLCSTRELHDRFLKAKRCLEDVLKGAWCGIERNINRCRRTILQAEDTASCSAAEKLDLVHLICSYGVVPLQARSWRAKHY
jgi:hypothetical protein